MELDFSNQSQWKITGKKIDISSTSVNCDEDTQTGAASLTVRLEWKTEFHNIPKTGAVRAQAWGGFGVFLHFWQRICSLIKPLLSWQTVSYIGINKPPPENAYFLFSLDGRENCCSFFTWWWYLVAHWHMYLNHYYRVYLGWSSRFFIFYFFVLSCIWTSEVLKNLSEWIMKLLVSP